MYITRRAREILSFYTWWRSTLIGLTLLFAVLAVVSDSARGLFVILAAVPAMVVLGMLGARVSAHHRQISQLQSDISSVGVARHPQPHTSPTPREAPEPLGQAPPIEPAASPDVTIVVTAFDDGRFILDCLESIRRQTWTEFQCVVIDDSSTDDTMRIAFEQFRDDRRFEFIQKRDRSGVSHARNLGLDLARGPWVTFLDGDDYLFVASLESRLNALEAHRAEPWVAGIYCSWVPVPEDSPLEFNGKKLPERQRVSWLDSLHDAPFIASAPILRTAVARAVGGFRDLANAEDTDMWMRILRNGWVFEPINYTGVAYRQKRLSRFRSGAADHATATVDLYRANYEPIREQDIASSAPFVFDKPAFEYVISAATYRRNLIALTTSVAVGDSAGIARLRESLTVDRAPYLDRVVDVRSTVLHAARRSESHRADGATIRAGQLASRVMPLVPPSDAEPSGEIAKPPQQLNPEPWGRLNERRHTKLTQASAAKLLANHVILMPGAAYHVEELGPLAEALDRRGLPVAFMVSERRWPLTEPGLRPWDYPTYAFPEEHDWVSTTAGLVTLNDWGEAPHEAIIAGNAAGVPTFAKVEGVQDFNDDDIDRERFAYQTAQHILCQGANDRRALPASVSPFIVGSSRLEAIWSQPPRRPTTEQVVVNLNFTYGVLETARDMWVETVLQACERVSVRPVFSLHPAERIRPSGATITDLPMKHLMTSASLLISRFSTVPFEAMARGVPFVYHNPHNEQVPTFLTPNGAFDITATAGELAEAIVSSRKWVDSYRARSEDFFRTQVDIDSNVRSADRAADVIHKIVTGD